jgi:hypothetical protein
MHVQWRGKKGVRVLCNTAMANIREMNVDKGLIGTGTYLLKAVRLWNNESMTPPLLGWLTSAFCLIRSNSKSKSARTWNVERGTKGTRTRRKDKKKEGKSLLRTANNHIQLGSAIYSNYYY